VRAPAESYCVAMLRLHVSMLQGLPGSLKGRSSVSSPLAPAVYLLLRCTAPPWSWAKSVAATHCSNGVELECSPLCSMVMMVCSAVVLCVELAVVGQAVGKA
jgi:hypothetical protein